MAPAAEELKQVDWLCCLGHAASDLQEAALLGEREEE